MPMGRLPTELLHHVFSFIGSAQQLGQCRLVCKHWNYYAERAMFGTDIICSKASTARALHYHLSQNRELGKLIKSMQLISEGDSEINIYLIAMILGRETEEYLRLLPLAFTPTMKYLKGYIMTPIIFKRLVDVARASNASFSNLRTIPTPSSDCIGEYYNTIAYFKDTLTHVDILYSHPDEIPWNVFRQLGKFIKLTSLHISGSIDSIEDLNLMLANCRQLQELSLELDEKTEEATEMNNMLVWMESHVEKVSTLTKIDIHGTQQPDIVEYLLYKYPKSAEARNEEVRLHHNYGPTWIQRPADTRAIRRIINALQILPLYRLYYSAGIHPIVLEDIKKQVVAYDRSKMTIEDKGPHRFWVEMMVVREDNPPST
ncbi:hypothetical protein MBANPS3_002126 [Mucor bainieri]